MSATVSKSNPSGHVCSKCDRPNPWEFPQTLGYQRYEAALAVHYLLWTINAEVMRLLRKVLSR